MTAPTFTIGDVEILVDPIKGSNSRIALQDLTGREFGRLYVLGRSPVDGAGRQARWVCLCECGVLTTISGEALRTGNSRACGCRILHPERQAWARRREALESTRISIWDVPDETQDAPGNEIDPQSISAIVSQVLGTLPEREEKVLRLRFGIGGNDFPRTLKEVGTIFNVTRERVRQIETKALNKLRHLSRRKKLIKCWSWHAGSPFPGSKCPQKFRACKIPIFG